MKKVLLAAAITLIAAPAFASSVVGSKHDMTSNDPGTNTEVCVYCHTPHGASTTVKPLWNRGVGTVGSSYNSATLDQTNSRPGIVSAAITASDAGVCLSCHDGSIAGELLNPPNSGTTGAIPAITGNLKIDTNGLTDDHPIGMNYSAVVAADTAGFFAPTGTYPNEKVGSSAQLYTANGVMWCSSCHDVHNDANAPFLVTNNAASGLCRVCHNK